MEIMGSRNTFNTNPLNTFYVGGGRGLQVFQELRLNVGMLRLGCSTIRGYKLGSVDDLVTPLYQRQKMTVLKRNLIWIWQVLTYRERGPHSTSLHCRGLLRVQVRMAQWNFKRIVFGMRVRFRFRRWRRMYFFRGRIRHYNKILRPRFSRIQFHYRKIDASRIIGRPISSFTKWPSSRQIRTEPQKTWGIVYKHTRFLAQSLLPALSRKNVFVRGYHSVRKIILVKSNNIKGRAISHSINKLLGSTADLGPQSMENLQILRFLSKIVELQSVTKLVRLQYNSLTVSCAMYIHTKMNLLGYFHADFDLAFGVDFKSYVVRMVLTLFNSVVSMHDYISIVDSSLAQPQPEPTFQKSRVVSRRIFLNAFGTSGIRGGKLPYKLIKFKPGYQIFFRKLRCVHKELNHLRFRYQHRMTSHLLRFQHLNNSVILKLSMLSIKQVLVHTRLFINQGELECAIAHGFIFVNGRSCTGLEFQLQVGDYVQYRATYHTYSEVLCTFKARADLLGRGHGILGRYVQGPFIGGTPLYARHGMTGYIGKSVFNKFHLHRLVYYYHHFFDTPAYIELDYMLLGFIVITLPNSTSDYEFIMARKSSVTMLKMLNWKYIV